MGRGDEGQGGVGRAGGRRQKRGRDEGEEGTDGWRREKLRKTREEGEKETFARAKHAPLRDGRGRQGGCRGGKGREGERPTPQFWMSPRVQSNNVAKLCGGLRFIFSVLRALKNHTKCILRGSPTVGSTSSSVRLHIYEPSHIIMSLTEICHHMFN